MTTEGEALRIVVIGVAGSGKSTLGAALAAALGCVFQEGDALHPPANLRKIGDGRPLNETDRRPWMDAVAGWLAERRAAGQRGVVSCSALKHDHRDRLRRADPDLCFVLLNPSRVTLEQRLAGRVGHIFPATLLQSQLDAFEPPDPNEGVLEVDPMLPVTDAVSSVLRRLGA